MLDVKDVNFRICKYKIDRVTLTIPGIDDYTVTPLVTGDFVIEKDFDGYQYPYFRLTVGVPNKVYRAMRKNYTNVQAYVRMVYAYFKTEDTTGKTREEITTSNYIADNFIVYIEDSTPEATFEKDNEYEKQMMSDGLNTDYQNMTTVEILLYKVSDLNLIKKMPMAVLHNVTLIDALTYYLSISGVSNVLCSPPDNNTRRYNEFVIPPLRVDEQILRICCDYGLHKYGTSLFFDFDRRYILNKINKCTAWETNEYKTIYLINFNFTRQVKSVIQGCSYEARDHSGYCTISNVKALSQSIEREQVYGSTAMVLDKKTGEYTTMNADTISVKGGGGVSRAMVSYSGDQSTYKAVQKRLEEESIVMSAILDGADLTMLSPNRLFQFVFLADNASKYDGAYRLTKYVCTFRSEDGEWFTPTVLATFVGKKPK